MVPLLLTCSVDVFIALFIAVATAKRAAKTVKTNITAKAAAKIFTVWVVIKWSLLELAKSNTLQLASQILQVHNDCWRRQVNFNLRQHRALSYPINLKRSR